MPAKAHKRPGTRPAHIPFDLPPDAVNPSVDRAISDMAGVVARLDSNQVTRVRLVLDLVVGANRVAHKLGKVPSHCLVTPTVADAGFAYALTAADKTIATITVIGVDQPGAGVIFE